MIRHMLILHELSNRVGNILYSVITSSLLINLAGSVLISKWSWWFLQKLSFSLKKMLLMAGTTEQDICGTLISKWCLTCLIQLFWINSSHSEILLTNLCRYFKVGQLYNKVGQLSPTAKCHMQLLQSGANITKCVRSRSVKESVKEIYSPPLFLSFAQARNQ